MRRKLSNDRLEVPGVKHAKVMSHINQFKHRVIDIICNDGNPVINELKYLGRNDICRNHNVKLKKCGCLKNNFKIKSKWKERIYQIIRGLLS